MLLILILAAILLCGSEVHESCQRAMRLWRDNLIPGMLLPMILVRLIQARGGFDHLKLALFNKLFNMENNSFACFMCASLPVRLFPMVRCSSMSCTKTARSTVRVPNA